MSDRYSNRDGVYDSLIGDYSNTDVIVFKLNRIADLEAKLAVNKNGWQVMKVF